MEITLDGIDARYISFGGSIMPTIRGARPEDFYEVSCLLRQLWPNKSQNEGALKDIYRRSLDSTNDVLLCVEINNKVVGFGSMILKNSFWQEAYVGYITTLIVEEELRNKGIGRMLLDELNELARKLGCKKVELDSGFHREQAHDIYEHYGFKKRAYLFSKDV